MGTPEFAVPSLRSVAERCDVAAVVTQPDRPRGRGRTLAASAVAEEAGRLGLEIWKPEDVRVSEMRDRLAAVAPDLFAVVAFGAILTPALLALPKLGSLNLHGSLLPDYRGASPVQRALWDGRGWTGVTTLWMDEGVDTGDCALQRWTAIEPADDAGTLTRRLASLGAPLLAESLVRAHAGELPRLPQELGAGSYARKLRKEDGRVNWALDAVTVWNRQRAMTPWPGATTAWQGRRLRIEAARPAHVLPTGEPAGTVLGTDGEDLLVACAPGALLVTRVTPEGRASMPASEWARGARVEAGGRLGIGTEREEEAHA